MIYFSLPYDLLWLGIDDLWMKRIIVIPSMQNLACLFNSVDNYWI